MKIYLLVDSQMRSAMPSIVDDDASSSESLDRWRVLRWRAFRVGASAPDAGGLTLTPLSTS